ncbi:MAG: hypothetical protein AMJ69_09990 [Gammaproteobacteria bacterium SG8_47]|nr:MAG: hypothetical protein AMJ69_09990 [Gammaproteobacteria bacterium SG8_47]
MVLALIPGSLSAKEGDEFPGRSLFPTIDVIEVDDLKQRLKDVVVVDVRSRYEYDTLRIKGARHIQLGSKTFIDEMRALRAEDPKRTIVTYCNGKTCMKSYKAARECKLEKIDGVVAYDAGIMDWAKAYPDDAQLLGRSPVDPKKLLSKDKFNSHTLEPEKFEVEAGKNNVIVVDMRDRFQREATSLFVGKETRVYLDDQDALDKLIAQAKRENKTLIIYDQAGKQVQWLQYYLEDKDLTNYYFMKGGSREYFKYLRAQL